MTVKLAVHQKDIITLGLSCLDERVLCLLVCRIKKHDLVVLICLLPCHCSLVILDAEILVLSVLEKAELHSPVAELLVREHSVLDEELEVVPLLFELLTLVSEDLVKTVCHLLGDVCRNLLYIGIALEVASRHIERNVR